MIEVLILFVFHVHTVIIKRTNVMKNRFVVVAVTVMTMLCAKNLTELAS